jgi:hypothetical protein
MTALRNYVYQGGTFSGTITAPVSVSAQAVGSAGNAAFNLLNPAGTISGQFYWDHTDNSVNINNDLASPGNSLQLNQIGDFVAHGSGNCFKVGGGPWAAISDARIKTVAGDYTSGLAELLQLHPVTYRYRPDCGISDTQTTFVGMIAQDVEPVLPNMVHKTKGTVDGVAVDDLRSLDTNELQYLLINSIKELDARLKALETP